MAKTGLKNGRFWLDADVLPRLADKTSEQFRLYVFLVCQCQEGLVPVPDWDALYVGMGDDLAAIDEPIVQTIETMVSEGLFVNAGVGTDMALALPGSDKADHKPDATELVKLYREQVKPLKLDNSTQRAKRNIIKLLNGKKVTVDDLAGAIRDYGRFCVNAETEPQYRKNVGNFFGRDRVFEEHLEGKTPTEFIDDIPLRDTTEAEQQILDSILDSNG